MVYLKVKKLLEEKGKSKYWLVKKMEANYKVVSDMVEGETAGIRFQTIDKLCNIFECDPGDLFVKKEEI